jgi:1,4-alpha-glucan branching enzyme
MSHRAKLRLGVVLVLALLVAVARGAAAEAPMGATFDPGGNATTFRVWAPFAQSVAVEVNNAAPVALSQEAGHVDDDATFSGTVAGAKPGDQYRYVIKCNGQTGKFDDPRARQLSGTDPATSHSIVTAPLPAPAPFTTPNFNEMVIYEMHVGSFHADAAGHFNFKGAIDKLDHLKDLGINAVELMPIHENIEDAAKHHPPDFNWGYDAAQLFAIESSYGTPQDFADFVSACHARGIAVIVDVVYNHLVDKNLLTRFGNFSDNSIPNGAYFYGPPRGDTGFGPRPDFGRPQVQQYIRDNALMWLRDYGVDGLRWDSTSNIRAFNDGHDAIDDGVKLMHDTNDSYRNTDPKQPGKIAIAEDLAGRADVVKSDGMAFNSQWDDDFFRAVRDAVVAVNDGDRNLNDVAGAINKKFRNDDVFMRVIYSEDHDKVGHPKDKDRGQLQLRLPALIDTGDAESLFAKKRSTLAAAIVMTSPGIPMIFQGQEMLETRAFEFPDAVPIDWDRVQKFKGIVQLYHDLIALRRNLDHHTAGLTLQERNVFHVDSGNKTLAYHRFGSGGAGDDVVVVANFANNRRDNLNIGFPRGGRWKVRFNSGAQVYDPTFTDGDSFDTDANPGDKDGLHFNANVGIGPYSVVIFSQDP